MAVYILGAPGSGKSSVRRALAAALPRRLVFDWDDFIEAASALAGTDVRRAPDTWVAYRSLVRAAIDAAGPERVVVLGVCTPAELAGWPIEQWLVLDCDDEERSRRMGDRPADVSGAVADAADYRALGLPIIDTTTRAPAEVAAMIVEVLRNRS